MEGKELSVTLREMARGMGLCDEWYGKWADETDIDTLLEKYIAGIDFCTEKDYPSLEFARKYFSSKQMKEALHRHNIYLDEEVNVVDDKSGVWVLLGKCSGRITLNGWAVANVHVRHESHVRIDAEDLSRVFVWLYEDSKSETRAQFGSMIKVYDFRKRQ